MVSKIISGGQSGADQASLAAAYYLGIATGGYAPKNFLTEIGPLPKALENLGLVDSGGGYVYRTNLNVEHSDVTIWFGRDDTPGFKATKNAAVRYGKPFYREEGMTTKFLRQIFNMHDTVNIAGNRASKNPDIFMYTFRRIVAAFDL